MYHVPNQVEQNIAGFWGAFYCPGSTLSSVGWSLDGGVSWRTRTVTDHPQYSWFMVNMAFSDANFAGAPGAVCHMRFTGSEQIIFGGMFIDDRVHPQLLPVAGLNDILVMRRCVHPGQLILPDRLTGIGQYVTGGMMDLCPECHSGLRRRVPWE